MRGVDVFYSPDLTPSFESRSSVGRFLKGDSSVLAVAGTARGHGLLLTSESLLLTEDGAVTWNPIRLGWPLRALAAGRGGDLSAVGRRPVRSFDGGD